MAQQQQQQQQQQQARWREWCDDERVNSCGLRYATPPSSPPGSIWWLGADMCRAIARDQSPIALVNRTMVAPRIRHADYEFEVYGGVSGWWSADALQHQTSAAADTAPTTTPAQAPQVGSPGKGAASKRARKPSAADVYDVHMPHKMHKHAYA